MNEAFPVCHIPLASAGAPDEESFPHSTPSEPSAAEAVVVAAVEDASTPVRHWPALHKVADHLLKEWMHHAATLEVDSRLMFSTSEVPPPASMNADVTSPIAEYVEGLTDQNEDDDVVDIPGAARYSAPTETLTLNPCRAPDKSTHRDAQRFARSVQTVVNCFICRQLLCDMPFSEVGLNTALLQEPARILAKKEATGDNVDDESGDCSAAMVIRALDGTPLSVAYELCCEGIAHTLLQELRIMVAHKRWTVAEAVGKVDGAGAGRGWNPLMLDTNSGDSESLQLLCADPLPPHTLDEFAMGCLEAVRGGDRTELPSIPRLLHNTRSRGVTIPAGVRASPAFLPLVDQLTEETLGDAMSASAAWVLSVVLGRCGATEGTAVTSAPGA